MPQALLFIQSHREPDPQQIASVWCDLATALFGAFSVKDGESKRGEPARGGKWRRKKKTDRKTQLKRREEKKW